MSVLHGHLFTFPTHLSIPSPSAFVLNWHYLQCALQRFGTHATNEESCRYYVQPTPAFDSDDDNNDAGDLYPSAAADRIIAQILEPYQAAAEAAAVQRQVVSWRQGVPR